MTDETNKPPRASWEPAESPASPPSEPVAAPIEQIPASSPVLYPAPPQTDDPLAPLTASDVIPAPPPIPSASDDDEADEERPPRSRKLLVVAIATLVIGLVIAAFVVLGTLHKQNFAIVCEPDEIVAAQGRAFPPWGERSLDDGAMWKPIKIPPEAECSGDTTDDLDELSAWFLATLQQRADLLLKARDAAKVDEAAGLLEQALLHTRAPERRETRARIEQLLGDVTYWRASAKLRAASEALEDAAKQFDAAASKVPLHVTDAAAWAAHVRKQVGALRGGPGAATLFPPQPPEQGSAQPDRAPPGHELPVEPSDVGPPVVEPLPPEQAQIPSSGVLL
jgi:hypothetical protein